MPVFAVLVIVMLLVNSVIAVTNVQQANEIREYLRQSGLNSNTFSLRAKISNINDLLDARVHKKNEGYNKAKKYIYNHQADLERRG